MRPASEYRPRVVGLAEHSTLIEALRAGRIDAVVLGEIGNPAIARTSGGTLTVRTLDSRTEAGGIALLLEHAATAACLNRLFAWLTHVRRIGCAEWLDDHAAYLRRARQ